MFLYGWGPVFAIPALLMSTRFVSICPERREGGGGSPSSFPWLDFTCSTAASICWSFVTSSWTTSISALTPSSLSFFAASSPEARLREHKM